MDKCYVKVATERKVTNNQSVIEFHMKPHKKDITNWRCLFRVGIDAVALGTIAFILRIDNLACDTHRLKTVRIGK